MLKVPRSTSRTSLIILCLGFCSFIAAPVSSLEPILVEQAKELSNQSNTVLVNGTLTNNPVSWQQFSYRGKDYFFIKTRINFDGALSLCKSRNERLVSIKSKAEQEFVWKTIVKPAGQWTWLGATNVLGTKNFTWLADGSDVTSQYSNWSPSHPIQDANQRNAIWMSSYNGKWYDYSVSDTDYVLCERVVLEPENGTDLNNNHTSSQQYSYRGKDYFFIKKEKSFEDALNLCWSRNESLVSIKSAAEQEFVFNTILKPAGNFTWLGATNVLGTKNFKWLSDGSDVTSQYSNWYRSSPNGDVNKRNAIFMFGDGKWLDEPVIYTNYVLCERGSAYALESSLLEQSKQFNAKIKVLDTQLKTVSERGTERANNQRAEYFKLISETKQSNHIAIRQVANTQNIVNSQVKELLTEQQNRTNALEQSLGYVTQSMEQNDSTSLNRNLTDSISSIETVLSALTKRNDQLEKSLEKVSARLAAFQTIVDNDKKLEILTNSVVNDYNAKFAADDIRLDTFQEVLVAVANKVCDIGSQLPAENDGKQPQSTDQRKAECLDLIG